MKLISTTRRVLRGEVSPRLAALEAARRIRTLNERRRERAQLAELDRQPARLREEFARIRASDLLAHFRSRIKPKFLPGFQDEISVLFAIENEQVDPTRESARDRKSTRL